jgi:hypothetical protein
VTDALRNARAALDIATAGGLPDGYLRRARTTLLPQRAPGFVADEILAAPSGDGGSTLAGA